MSNLNPSQISDVLYQELGLPADSKLYVALSGGIDSTVLLDLIFHVVSERGQKSCLEVLHCNHGIHADADAWEKHCADLSNHYGVKFNSVKLNLKVRNEHVSEAEARIARYGWMRKFITSGSALLTAHHEQDNVETFFLNLMRGAGARGLAAIQPVVDFSDGKLVRPLLGFSRMQIKQYADQAGLEYVNDDANADLAYDRNYLRHVVIPLLRERWPTADASIFRSISNLSDVRKMTEEIAREDLDNCSTAGKSCFYNSLQLQVDKLTKLNHSRRKNLLRYWIRKIAKIEPPARRLDEFIDSVVLNDCSGGEMVWNGFKVAKFNQLLYLIRHEDNVGEIAPIWWDVKSELVVKQIGLKLIPKPVVGSGLRLNSIREGVCIKFREGGESIRLPRRSHSSSLKKVLQQEGVPTWERNLLPLVYVNDRLIAVPPCLIAHSHGAMKGESGVEISMELVT